MPDSVDKKSMIKEKPTKKQQLKNQIQVYMHDRDKNKQFKYCNNEIDTSKYTWWNFFPKAIILQFMRTANMYFLLSAIIISIEVISPLSPLTAIGPLILVLACSLVREAIEEHKRVENDKEVNQQDTLVYNNKKKFAEIPWKHLQVGDVVKIYKNQMFPADLFVLTSSDKQTGMAFVETANLDGERNLKTKNAIDKIHKYLKSNSIASMKANIKCDKPNNNIHVFRGQIDTQIIDNQQITDQSKQSDTKYTEQSFPLNNDNILLRGTILKNVEWVIGTIVYAGRDTKIMKNQGEVRNKVSKIEKSMNKLIICTFFLQQFFQALMAGFAYSERRKDFYDHEEYRDHYYLDLHGDGTFGAGTTAALVYAAFFILLNTFIPISLIISLEVVKLMQAGFIEFDEKMVYQELNFKPKVINTLIHEQLGEIQYIFTDKTGTLTSNNMVFTGCCIDKFEFTVKQLFDFVYNQRDKILNDKHYHKFYEFLLCLVLAHDCLLDEDAIKEIEESGNTIKKDIFQGSSPDEVCLVQLVYELGFQFLKRTQNALFINIGEEQKVYEFLQKIEFSSDRKRMSIIVKDPDTDKVILYTKGADSFILKNIQQQDHNSPTMILVKDSLQTFSKDGLRTLCLARKELDYEEFLEWQSEYNQSVQFGITDELFADKQTKKSKKKKEEQANQTQPRLWQFQKENKQWEYFEEDIQNDIQEAFDKDKETLSLTDELELHIQKTENDFKICTLVNIETQTEQKVRRLRTVETLENLLENNLELLGATAVEDKLQLGVPETLLDIQRAGIKVWMLTGDKLETAQNIGYLSNLLNKNSKIYILQADSKADTLRNIMRINSRLQKTKKKQKDQKLTKNKIEELNLKKQEKQLKDKKEFNRQQSDIDAMRSKTYQIAEMVQNDFISNASNKNIDGSIDHGGQVSVDIMSRLSKNKHDKPQHYEKFDLLIEGKCINYILNSADSQEEFLKLIPELSTVICFRSTPTQKAQVVNFVKQKLKKVTLSIGDGGNDVNMIQEADIGIGIIGKEGNQAALASDYYFGQFRFLWRLLFFHGRHNLRRTSYFINYFFFKNIIFTLIQVWFGFYSLYSAQSIWEDGYLLNFNSIITAVAPVYLAVFDKDLSPQVHEKVHYNFPLLYKETRGQTLFSASTFTIWFIKGSFYSVLIFFVSIYAHSNVALFDSGFTDDLWANSMCQYFGVVYVVFAVLFLDTKQWHQMTIFAYVFMSLFLFFPIFAVTWSYAKGPMQHQLWDHLGNLRFWLIVILNTLVPCILMWAFKNYKKFFSPTLADQMEDIQKEAIDNNMPEYEPDYGVNKQEIDISQSQIRNPNISKKLNFENLSVTSKQNINRRGSNQFKSSQFQKNRNSIEKSLSSSGGKSIDINAIDKVPEVPVLVNRQSMHSNHEVNIDEIQPDNNLSNNIIIGGNNISQPHINGYQNGDAINNQIQYQQGNYVNDEENLTFRGEEFSYNQTQVQKIKASKDIISQIQRSNSQHVEVQSQSSPTKGKKYSNLQNNNLNNKDKGKNRKVSFNDEIIVVNKNNRNGMVEKINTTSNNY